MKCMIKYVLGASTGSVKVQYVGLFFLVTFVNLSNSLSSSVEVPWSLAKQNAFSKLSNSNFISDKRAQYLGGKETDVSGERRWKKLAIKRGSESRKKIEDFPEHFVARQGGGGGWGWGWPSSHGAGGSYDVYTIIAVAAFAALFGALLYELMGGSSRRSLDSSLKLPPVSLGLDSERLPDVMVKLGDWIANSSWFENMGNSSKTIKDIGDKIGVKKWFEAFKKDPVEYQCIRKMACETLASSSLAKKSLKSNFGGVFLSAFGSFMENGDQLQKLVKDVVENPKMCEDLVEGDFCEQTT